VQVRLILPQRETRSSSRLPVLFLALVLLGAIASCSHAKKVVNLATLKPSPLDLYIAIAPDANGNSPVALDVALIKDKNFWKTAQAMPAKDWFAQRNDLQRRYRQKLDVYSWEWVPGQAIAPITIKVPRRFCGAMVFANYPSPGTHSAPIPLGGNVTISLQQDDFVMEAKP
jgi:type VI secretion system protein